MENCLIASDYCLTDKDRKKEEKELAKLAKIKESKSKSKKKVSEYQAEFDKLCKDYEESLTKGKKIEKKEPPKEKIKETLGGLQINQIISKSEKRKIKENINSNHIAMYERFLARESYSEVQNPVQTEKPKDSKKSIKNKSVKPIPWNLYSQFPAPKPQVSIPNTPLPPKPKPFMTSSTQYQLSLKMFHK